MSCVRIIADSTCDLSEELKERYQIGIIPLCIILDDESFYDGEEIQPDEIYAWADKNGKTPKTSAPGLEKTMEILKPYTEAGDDVIFFGISEQMSTSCNMVRLAARELEYEHIFVIDSENLSTGIGMQVVRAAMLAEQGRKAEEIVADITEGRADVRASFVVDTLRYLAMGGRCSSVTALLGNALRLKPMIEVKDGKMGVGKKFRGHQDKVIIKYAMEMREELLKADPEMVFITHSGCDPSIIQKVKEYLQDLHHFRHIYITRAGGVVSSHCGPGTLGVLFTMRTDSEM